MRSFVVDDKPLFLNKSVLEIEKTATFRMSRDPAKWEEEIMSYLHEENPFLQEFQGIRIHMNRTDPDTGMGVGQIVLNDKVAVPIIIDKFRLSPMDLFWHDGKLNALTKPSIMGALQQTSIGKTVEKGTGELADMSIYTDTQPPHLGRYAYASSLQFSVDELREAMESMGREGLEYALKSNQIFNKVAKQYSTHAQEVVTEKTASSPPTFKTSPVLRDVYFPVKETGAYMVIADGMKKIAGLVIDTVVDFSDNVLDGMKVFVGADGEYSMTDEIGGFSAPLEELRKLAMDDDPRAAGQYGFFWMTKKGHAVATIPVKVLYTGTNPDGLSFMKVAAASLDGASFTVVPSSDYEGMMVMDDHIFMGDEWKWARVGGDVKLASANVANKLGWPTDFGEIRHNEGRFYLNHIENEELSKAGESASTFYAKLKDQFDPGELLTLMKTAEDEGFAFFQYDIEEVKVASTKLAEFRKAFGVNPVNLTKEAAFIIPTDKSYEFFKFAADVTESEAAQTVDSILGLNFISDENIHKFLENIDTLEDAEHIVAKLLLASRLGLQIDESPLRTALFSLDDSIRQLQQLKSTNYGSIE